MKISAVVLTRNEERNIRRCLESLSWCDEIIVIDDFSTDQTVSLAKEGGAQVHQKELAGDFASQRNFGLERAKNEWVLFVDADEIVSPSLSQEIVRRIREKGVVGFYLPRRENFLGKTIHCADKPVWDWTLGPFKLLRLARKDAGLWQGKVHEVWQISGNVKTLNNPLIHHSFTNLNSALKKINLYTDIQAQGLKEAGASFHYWQIFLNPIGKLIKDLVWHGGTLDGTRGLIYCLLMSFHSFLARGKLWQLREGM
ncbi:MAG: glycosyltransferase family 2 protein [Patescibacteria group bacterium]